MRNLQLMSVTLTSILVAYALPAQAYAASMNLTSSVISSGAAISPDYACTGADHSPALAWSNAPESTKTFALIVEDPDAPSGTFIHWIVFDIPARVTSLPSGVPQTAEITGGGINGINGFDHIGYNGPCPPPGKTHHYYFRLFALDAMVSPGDRANADSLRAAMNGHVLATAQLVGTFER
jgi:Raf kinase inhibitor-like YbhB/YbcL family protein